VGDEKGYLEAIKKRVAQGVSREQLTARDRQLATESWQLKAREFEKVLLDGEPGEDEVAA